MAKVSEKVKAQRKQLAEDIAEAMKRDGLAWIKPWASIEFPRNGKTNRLYNGRNVFHLLSTSRRKAYTDPRWFTFLQAKKLGYHVIKDETSTAIEKWGRGTTKVGVDADGNDILVSFPVFQRSYAMFNAEQLDGIDPWQGQIEELDDEQTVAIIDRLVGSSRCPVIEGADKAYYTPTCDEVHVPDRRLFFENGSAEAYLRVLLHEMAHSTGNELGRKMGEVFGDEKYAFEELVAELTSVFVAGQLGFRLAFDSVDDEFAERHAAYLKHWASRITDSPDTLFRAASEAGKAADFIVERYEKADGDTFQQAA